MKNHLNLYNSSGLLLSMIFSYDNIKNIRLS